MVLISNRGDVMTEYSDKIADSFGFEKELVLEFFIDFSRFEYALKNANYVKCRSPTDNRAEVDWIAFLKDIKDQFVIKGNDKFEKAANYINDKPPKKQIFKVCKLDWSNTKRQNGMGDAEWYLKLIKQVRNNVFHGGKYPTGEIEEPARNRELLENSLTLLKLFLECSPEVKAKFENFQ